MKYLSIFALFAILAITSCNDENPGMKTLKVYASATVQDQHPFVTNGDNLVLHYYYKAPDEESIADDEFAEDFFLEIIPENGEFLMDSNVLINRDIQFIYRQYCFCGFVNRYSLTAYDLVGEETSNGNWNVSGTLTVKLEFVDEQTEEVQSSFERKLQLSGTYTLSTF